MASDLTFCKNCNRELKNDYHYCPGCGQQTGDELTLAVLFSTTISNYFSVDARFFKSIGPLLFRPGFLPKKFVGGKRKTYLHPVRMYLFVTIVFFFIFSFFIRDTRTTLDKLDLNKYGVQTSFDSLMNNVKSMDSAQVDSLIASINKDLGDIGMGEEEVADTYENVTSDTRTISDTRFPVRVLNTAKIDSLIDTGASDQKILHTIGMDEDAGFLKKRIYTQALKLYKNHEVGEIYQKFFDTIPVATFFLLPVFALLLMIFHLRIGRYVQHLVFSFYFFSFVFVIMTIIFLFNRWFSLWPDILNGVCGIVPLIYLWIGLKRYYNQSWKASIIKGVGVVFLFLLIILPLSLFLVSLYTFMYY